MHRLHGVVSKGDRQTLDELYIDTYIDTVFFLSIAFTIHSYAVALSGGQQG